MRVLRLRVAVDQPPGADIVPELPGKHGGGVNMNLSQRKQYAKQCYLKGRTDSRAFDNCFENENGDEVVRYLYTYAMYATPERIEYVKGFEGKTIRLDSAEYREMKKVEQSLKLRAALIKSGTFDYWEYFCKNGTYVGFTEKKS